MSILVKNYCEALLNASGKDAKIVDAQLKDLAEFFRGNREVYIAFSSDIVRQSTKHEMLRVFFLDNEFCLYIQRFLKLLIDNKRLSLIFEIAETFKPVGEMIEARLTSSMPLTLDEIEEFSKILEQKFGKKFSCTNIVNPKILAGVIVEYGSIILDLSLKGQIDLMQEASKQKLIQLVS